MSGRLPALLTSLTFAAALPGISTAQSAAPSEYTQNGAELGAANPVDSDAPSVTRVPDTSLAGLFHVDPNYRRGTATGSVKVVGAFRIAETNRTHLVAAWSPGFLPVTLSFSDGRCFSLDADYRGGTLSNGRLSKAECGMGQKAKDAPVSRPVGQSMELVGSSWGYTAWADKRAGITIITAPHAETFQPLFTAQFVSNAIVAMNSPDVPGGNVTLIGRIDGHLTVVTLEVFF